MNDVAIRVEGIGKRYQLGGTRERYSTLRDQIQRWTSVGSLFRRRKQTDSASSFWALKDVSFEVRRGDVVGIIGRNGAGKSTLLKILSRITEPTEGEVDIHGRVGSLLEVGTGFHPELTGRENVYLNGAILGMKRTEIVSRFDEIVAFAEVEKFIDTPVKHYSSGMYTRLAFAVAAHLEPEILVVDEVLAVGDIEFQKKCLGKMGEVAKGGRTVLFVSHNMHAVNTLCGRGLVLQGGRIVFDGSAQASVAKYLELFRSGGAGLKSAVRAGSGEWRFFEVAPQKPVFQPAEPIGFAFRVGPTSPEAGAVFLSGLLVNDQGLTLAQFDSRLVGRWIVKPQSTQGVLRIDGLWLKPGQYTLDLYVCAPSGIVDRVEAAAEFEISEVLPYPQPASADSTAGGVVLADYSWQLEPAVSLATSK